MSHEQEALLETLYKFLKTQGYRPVAYDSSGKKSIAKYAVILVFDFIRDGVNYGTGRLTIDNSNKLTVYINDKITHSPSAKSDDGSFSWTQLLKYLRDFTFGKLDFELKDTDDWEYDMAKRKDNEKLDEGYHPINKNTSYSDNVPNVKIRIQHSKSLGEGEQRYRNVARIFIENANGERFMLETKKPGIARVYARHVAEGGRPYDDKWNHISSLVEDYTKMAGFVRATKNGQFNESTQTLVNEGAGHYISLRETLHKLSGKKGYNNYFESWSPALTEDTETADLSEMFISSSLDPRIESAMPILAKLSKKVTEITEMNEVSQLDRWASRIIGENLTPTGESQVKKLVELLSNPLPVGPSADNILPLLSDLNLYSDELTEILKDLAEQDSDTDAVPAIVDWMSNSNNHKLHLIVNQLNSEPNDVAEGMGDDLAYGAGQTAGTLKRGFDATVRGAGEMVDQFKRGMTNAQNPSSAAYPDEVQRGIKPNPTTAMDRKMTAPPQPTKRMGPTPATSQTEPKMRSEPPMDKNIGTEKPMVIPNTNLTTRSEDELAPPINEIDDDETSVSAYDTARTQQKTLPGQAPKVVSDFEQKTFSRNPATGTGSYMIQKQTGSGPNDMEISTDFQKNVSAPWMDYTEKGGQGPMSSFKATAPMKEGPKEVMKLMKFAKGGGILGGQSGTLLGEEDVAEARDSDANFGSTVTRGSWVVYDGSKVKRFKSREGAKAYAEKNGGKVASSEFYADKIQKQGVAEDINNPASEKEIIDGMYNEWMNSEYAPMDDESGDDRIVISKAQNFLFDKVPEYDIERWSEELANRFHGLAEGHNDMPGLSPEMQRAKQMQEIMMSDTPPQDDNLNMLKAWAEYSPHRRIDYYVIAKFGNKGPNRNVFGNSVQKTLSAISNFPDMGGRELYDQFDLDQRDADRLYVAYENVADDFDQSLRQGVSEGHSQQFGLIEQLLDELSQGMEEDLDANQKKAGQLGPTDKVSTGKILGNKPQSQQGLRGKLVGASESADPLIAIRKLSGLDK